MKILLIEPYFAGSHASWAKGYAHHSQHDVQLLHLAGQYWKWRMHGGAVTLARRFLDMSFQPDLILSTDMLDLTTFLALTRTKTAHIPTAVYFHENQITYPWSPGDRDVLQNRDKHYGFINYTSALAADQVFFNSEYHRRSFLAELPRLLKHFPDHRELGSVDRIKSKCRILPLGFDFDRLDLARSDHDEPKRDSERVPLILWNHRWEYDKNPDDFFKALYALSDKGLDFQVAVLGENFSQSPEIFDHALARLGNRIVHFGFVESFPEYAGWLNIADILPVTSLHDFFGMSVVEAVYCGCYPLLPARLSYPEIFPLESWKEVYYRDMPELIVKLEQVIKNIERVRSVNLRSSVARFSWTKLAPEYDAVLQTQVS